MIIDKQIDYVFSTDEEYYYDDVDYILECVEDLENDEKDNDINITIYVAEKVERKHKEFIDVDSLIERMQELSYDVGGEFSESYLEDITKEQKVDMEKVILEYFNENIRQPSFFTVKNVKEIDVEEFKKLFC